MLWVVPVTQPKIDYLISLIEGAQKVAGVLIIFITSGLGGIILAWTKIRQQVRAVDVKVGSVEQQVGTVSHELTDTHEDTLRANMSKIEEVVSSETKAREVQHRNNSRRLDQVVTDINGLRTEIGEIRTLVQKVLSKMAGL